MCIDVCDNSAVGPAAPQPHNTGGMAHSDGNAASLFAAAGEPNSSVYWCWLANNHVSNIYLYVVRVHSARPQHPEIEIECWTKIGFLARTIAARTAHTAIER